METLKAAFPSIASRSPGSERLRPFVRGLKTGVLRFIFGRRLVHYNGPQAIGCRKANRCLSCELLRAFPGPGSENLLSLDAVGREE